MGWAKGHESEGLVKYRRRRHYAETSAPKPECRKCGKFPFASKSEVLRMMEINKFGGHAYRCGNFWHHGSSESRGPSNSKVCELQIFHSRRHAIEGLRLVYKPCSDLPNVKICRHWSHGVDRVWHVVPFDDGVLTKTAIRALIDPDRHSREKLKKSKSQYRNNGLMVELWENEGGAIQ